jgi:hypothetical protein
MFIEAAEGHSHSGNSCVPKYSFPGEAHLTNSDVRPYSGSTPRQPASRQEVRA